MWQADACRGRWLPCWGLAAGQQSRAPGVPLRQLFDCKPRTDPTALPAYMLRRELACDAIKSLTANDREGGVTVEAVQLVGWPGALGLSERCMGWSSRASLHVGGDPESKGEHLPHCWWAGRMQVPPAALLCGRPWEQVRCAAAPAATLTNPHGPHLPARRLRTSCGGASACCRRRWCRRCWG